MPLSSKFLTEPACEKIVKISQYLVKIWSKCNSLLFLGQPVYTKSSILFSKFNVDSIRRKPEFSTNSSHP